MKMKVHASGSLKEVCEFVNSNGIAKENIVSLMCVDSEYKLVYFG